jgi:hypothetical protein
VGGVKHYASPLLTRPGLTSNAGLTLIVLVFLAIVAAWRDYIPYWDARSYFDCIVSGTTKPFNLLDFRCVAHPSVVYLFLLGLARRFAPWDPAWMYAVNGLLGAASIVAFHRLVRALFPGRAPVEYGLVAALYAFAPLIVVHAVFLNVDYGMTAFAVLFLAALLAKRFWAASFAATAMMLSKEIGAAAFGVSVAAFVAAFTLRTAVKREERVASLLGLAPLLAAPALIAVYVVAAHQSGSGESWLGAYLPVAVINDRVDFYLNANLADPSMRAYLADIFILNGQWVYTAAIAAACGLALVRAGDKGREPVGITGGGVFLGLVMAGLVYAVTRYRVYNNARYVMIVAPILILAFYGSLLSLFRSLAVRLAVLTAASVLVLASNFRTVDVVSKRVFGTFDFGTHALLDLPSFTHGARLDSIVYNFESLQFHYLLDDAMHDLRPTARTILFMGDGTYNFPPPVDGRTFDLTLDPSHAVPLSILSGDGDVERGVLRAHHLEEGDRFFYLAFANVDNHQLRLLRNRYPVVATKQYNRAGYTLDVHTFTFTAGN